MINGFELFHDTRDLTYRFPFGAIAAGGSVTLSLAAAADCDLHGELSVSVHFEADTSLGHLSFDVPMDRQSVLKEGRIERMFRSEISSFDTAGGIFIILSLPSRNPFSSTRLPNRSIMAITAPEQGDGTRL